MASLFPAFYDCPPRIRLVRQETDEHIELFLRQHWIKNVPWVIAALIGLLVPVFLPAAEQFLSSITTFSIPVDLYISFTILWYMFILAYIIESFLHWYFNIYIVTNKHLVDINFWNLLYRDITEVRIDDVESARTHIRGVLGPLFNFGDVVERAGEENMPNYIAQYLYDLAQIMNKFYEAEPIIKSEKEIRDARLALVEASAKTLKNGLNLLGIKTLEKM